MAERSYPFVDGVTTDAEYSALFRQVFPSSVFGYYGSEALKVTADSGGMRVKVAPGTAAVRGHAYKNDASATLAIAANSGSTARTDTVVLHLEYGTTKSVTLRIVQGPAGGAAPALTQTDAGVFQLPLANVAVAAGAVTISAAAVTDRRTWWGLELLRMAGIAIGPTQPAPTAAFVWLRTQ